MLDITHFLEIEDDENQFVFSTKNKKCLKNIAKY